MLHASRASNRARTRRFHRLEPSITGPAWAACPGYVPRFLAPTTTAPARMPRPAPHPRPGPVTTGTAPRRRPPLATVTAANYRSINWGFEVIPGPFGALNHGFRTPRPASRLYPCAPSTGIKPLKRRRMRCLLRHRHRLGTTLKEKADDRTNRIDTP